MLSQGAWEDNLNMKSCPSGHSLMSPTTDFIQQEGQGLNPALVKAMQKKREEIEKKAAATAGAGGEAPF